MGRQGLADDRHRAGRGLAARSALDDAEARVAGQRGVEAAFELLGVALPEDPLDDDDLAALRRMVEQVAADHPAPRLAAVVDAGGEELVPGPPGPGVEGVDD